MSIVSPEFFDRPTLTVARELLGLYLVRRVGGNPSTGLRAREVALMITEVEAYDGFRDMASHASRGQTPRNTPMFGKPGTIYVYFTYGMHWMLNIVCGKEAYPAAILIRGVEDSVAIVRSGEMNGSPTPARTIATGSKAPAKLNGPAKLTKFLQIDKALNTKPLGKKTGLWIENRGVVIPKKHIQRTPRIGVDYSGVWAKKPWRFIIQNT